MLDQQLCCSFGPFLMILRWESSSSYYIYIIGKICESKSVRWYDFCLKRMQKHCQKPLGNYTFAGSWPEPSHISLRADKGHQESTHYSAFLKKRGLRMGAQSNRVCQRALRMWQNTWILVAKDRVTQDETEREISPYLGWQKRPGKILIG